MAKLHIRYGKYSRTYCGQPSILLDAFIQEPGSPLPVIARESDHLCRVCEKAHTVALRGRKL